MALSGSVTTPSSHDRSVTLKWSATQSVANNTSTISWTLVGSGSASGWVKVSELRIIIDGSQVYYRNDSNHTNCYNGTELASGSKTITHNSDGSKSFSIKVEAGIYQWAINCSNSKTFTLDSIARASSISSVSNTTLGNSCNIKWTPASTSFYYKVKLSISNWSWNSSAIAPKTTSEYTYSTPSLTLDIAKQLPNTTSGTMTVYLYTYSDSSCSTKVGSTASKTFTVYVPSSMIPTINSMSVSIVNDNSVVNGWGLFVKGYSKAKINCDASGTYNSTINNYTLSGGYTGSTSSMPLTTSILKSSGTIEFKCVAKDSRGRNSSAVSKSITVYNYYSPSISNFSVERSTEDNTKIIAKVNYSFASVNSKNSAIAVLYYKESKSSSWIEYGDIENNTSTTLDLTFSQTISYNFKVIVTDSLSKTDKSETFISTIEVLMNFRAGGKGLGIGKIAESDALEIAMDSKFFNNMYIKNGIAIIGKTTDDVDNEILSISTSNNTTVGYGGYINAKGNTNIYGNDVIIFSAKAGNVYYRPYYRAGDTISGSIFTGGFISSNGVSVYFTIPLTKPIIGTPTVSVSSSEGFVIRQDNKYLYGTAADTYVKPSEYTVNLNAYGIRIVATFDNTTNVTNNSACGVFWNGTIVFS